MLACATIAPGLRTVVDDEMRELGPEPVDDELDNAGWATFEVDGTRQLARALASARTIHRLGVVLASGRVDPEEPWSDLDDLVDAIDAERWFAGGPFAVRGHRTGEHPFTSVDVAAHVGDALHDHLASELGERPEVDLDDPDAILRVHLDDEGNARLWLDLAGQAGLHRRGYRVYDHPAGMKASLASALLQMTGPRGEGAIADPMGGGGTLVAEAAWRVLDVAPQAIRGDELLAWNAPAMAEHRSEVPTLGDLQAREAPRFVLGDHSVHHVEGAQRNLERAAVGDLVETYVGDASQLPDHVDEAELVATNPPYGIRSGEGPLRETYADLADAACSVLAEGGRLGVMTPKAGLVGELAGERGLEPTGDVQVQHGRLTIHLIVLEA